MSDPTPLLFDGQRLGQAEFHTRYEAMPPETRAELIDGVVHILTGPITRFRGRTNAAVATWLAFYRANPWRRRRHSCVDGPG